MNNVTVAAGPVVDWFSFTIKTQHLEVTVNDLQKRFYGSTPCVRGGLGYSNSCYILGSGRIYWSPERVDMGVHVVLPASALASFSALEHFTPQHFVNEFLSYGAKFTRIDIAMDSEAVHMDTIVASWEAGEDVSKSSKRRYMRDEKGAQSLYVGSRQSDRMVRFYDKALEQGLKDGQTWTRCEVEFKGDSAQLCSAYIAADRCMREIILSTIDFRSIDDTNKSRRTRCDWWQDWVLVFDSLVSFAIGRIEQTIEKSYQWLVQTVAPTMAFLSFAFGNTFWLNSMAESAAARVQPYKFSVLQVYEGEAFA